MPVVRGADNIVKSNEEVPTVNAINMQPDIKTNHDISLDPSTSFMSEPSFSEEELETIGSSQLDFQKKLLYRQKLREFDSQSVGDTSLSSSNISTSPQQFRIQFDEIRTRGKVKNKVKAASDRLSLSSMVQINDKTFRTTLDGTHAGTLQSVMVPPLGDTSEDSKQKLLPLSNEENHDGHTLSEDSQSSVDSIRGISFTTEQAGGENTSSSALQASQSIAPSTTSQPKEDLGSARVQASSHGGGAISTAMNYDGGNKHNIRSSSRSAIDAHRPRVTMGSMKGNPSSWSNDSSSPFAKVGSMKKSHLRLATWDGSRQETTRDQTLGQNIANPFLNRARDITGIDTAVHAVNPWLPSYQQPDDIRYHYAPPNFRSEHESDESEYSYVSSTSCTSSSYTDSHERLNVPGITPEYRKVKFVSDKDDTKFDSAMRRVGSVLGKPRELQIYDHFSSLPI